MKASELIEQIRKSVDEHGDLEIRFEDESGYRSILNVGLNESFQGSQKVLVIYGKLYNWPEDESETKSNRHLMEISVAKTGYFIPGTRVTLDGEDVSSRCTEARRYFDGTGEVVLHVLDEQGKVKFLGDDVETETRTGVVEITPPSEVIMRSSKEWAALQERWIQADIERRSAHLSRERMLRNELNRKILLNAATKVQ